MCGLEFGVWGVGAGLGAWGDDPPTIPRVAFGGTCLPASGPTVQRFEFSVEASGSSLQSAGVGS